MITHFVRNFFLYQTCDFLSALRLWDQEYWCWVLGFVVVTPNYFGIKVPKLQYDNWQVFCKIMIGNSW